MALPSDCGSQTKVTTLVPAPLNQEKVPLSKCTGCTQQVHQYFGAFSVTIMITEQTGVVGDRVNEVICN